MAKQSDFTPDEWKTLAAGPLMAGLYVSLSQASGPIGLAKEGGFLGFGGTLVTDAEKAVLAELKTALGLAH
jgi:hypothetical protein